MLQSRGGHYFVGFSSHTRILLNQHKKYIYLPFVATFTLNSFNIKSINDHGFLLKKCCRIIKLYPKKRKYINIIKEVHKPIPRISHIFELGITKRIILPNKGHKIRPLRFYPFTYTLRLPTFLYFLARLVFYTKEKTWIGDQISFD
jgi:hypothetical protein